MKPSSRAVPLPHPADRVRFAVALPRQFNGMAGVFGHRRHSLESNYQEKAAEHSLYRFFFSEAGSRTQPEPRGD